jgi:hypothetical protein
MTPSPQLPQWWSIPEYLTRCEEDRKDEEEAARKRGDIIRLLGGRSKRLLRRIARASGRKLHNHCSGINWAYCNNCKAFCRCLACGECKPWKDPSPTPESSVAGMCSIVKKGSVIFVAVAVASTVAAAAATAASVAEQKKPVTIRLTDMELTLQRHANEVSRMKKYSAETRRSYMKH